MTTDDRLRAGDLPVGVPIDLGEYHVTRAEIIAFAQQWDPQPFHVDEKFAAETVFRDVIGSGLHTMAIFQRLAVLGAYRRWAVIAGRTIRDVELHRPLRPDTTVRATVTVDAVTPQDHERALVAKTGRIHHDDTLLLRVHVDALMLRRP